MIHYIWNDALFFVILLVSFLGNFGVSFIFCYLSWGIGLIFCLELLWVEPLEPAFSFLNIDLHRVQYLLLFSPLGPPKRARVPFACGMTQKCNTGESERECKKCDIPKHIDYSDTFLYLCRIWWYSPYIVENQWSLLCSLKMENILHCNMSNPLLPNHEPPPHAVLWVCRPQRECVHNPKRQP